jgi:hypothetical protein
VNEGKNIIDGIWRNEVSEHNGKLYLLPGKWGADDRQIVINPSYFSPAAYRVFAQYHGQNWLKLADDSYLILQDIRNRVHRGDYNALPPNWIVLDKQTGEMRPFQGKADSYDYSYDAFRTLWRAAYDQLTSPNFKSWDYVSSFTFLDRDWEGDKILCSLYHYRNGKLECDTYSTGLAGAVGIFSVTNGYIGDQVVKRYYLQGDQLRFPEDSYYGRSWHWFATFLYSRS